MKSEKILKLCKDRIKQIKLFIEADISKVYNYDIIWFAVVNDRNYA